MKKLIMLTISFIISMLCFSQTINQENLAKEIEIAKGIIREKGLNNLDKIEGIYYLSKVDVSKDYEGDFAAAGANRTYYSNVYILIFQDDNDKKRFDIYQYSDQYGSGFFPRTTTWFIRKDNSRYFTSCSDCESIDDFFYYENEVIINNNDISFKEESKNKNFPGAYSRSYTTIQKIFPTTLEENIFKTGTGFFISLNGYIVTNYHVIENSTNIFVSNQIYNRLTAQVIFTDEFNDIAILKVEISLKTIPYNIVSNSKEIGSNVFTLGYPFIQSMGKEVKLTNGIINSTSGFEDDSRYYQFSAEIQPGNSGGPLFDSDGNIVGLVSAKHIAATNAGYALKSKFLIDFIKINEPTLLKKNLNTLSNLSLSSKYKAIKDFIVLLEIEWD